MRDLARRIIHGSKGIRVRVTYVSLKFSDKATEKVTELMRFELGILRPSS